MKNEFAYAETGYITVSIYMALFGGLIRAQVPGTNQGSALIGGAVALLATVALGRLIEVRIRRRRLHKVRMIRQARGTETSFDPHYFS